MEGAGCPRLARNRPGFPQRRDRGGRWIFTLCATDLSAGWTERVGIMGNSQAVVIAALEQVPDQLPFPLLGLHPDSGGEFMNWQLFRHQLASAKAHVL